MSKPESENRTVVATRSFVAGLAPAEAIFESLKSGLSDVPIMRFIIEQKGSGKNTRYTLPGGKVKPGESWQAGVQREVDEETGSRTFGLPHYTEIGKYKYIIPVKDISRQALLTYVPVVSIPSHQVKNPNITGIKVVSYKELVSLINGKKLKNVPIEEHLSFNREAGENALIKKKSLIKGVFWMGRIEEYLQKKFKAIWKDGMSEQDFNREYEKIKAEFMRRGLETGLGNELRKRQEDKSDIELAVNYGFYGKDISNFLLEIKKNIEKWLKKSPEKNKSEIELALNDGFYGKDILYFLPEIAKNGENWSGLENATEGTKIFMGYLTQSLQDFLTTKKMTKENFRSFMESKETPINKKTELINELNNYFIKKIKKTFKVDDGEVSQVYNYIREFLPELSKEIKLADPNLIEGLYQDFALSNEINNANFGRLLSLFFGIDIKKNNTEADNLIRFETGRHLLFLLKGMAGIKYFNAETEKIKNGYLQHAVEDFFGAISNQSSIKVDGKEMRVNLRGSKDSKMEVIVDEKNSKTFFSFLRKGFEQEMEKIKDFYSIGIVFVDSKKDSIREAKILIANFMRYLKSNYKSKSVKISEYKDHTKKYKNKEKPEIATGKRLGSMGDLLVRIKAIVHLGHEQMELAVYPFFSLSNDKYFMGWKEKMEDDPQYSVRRMLVGKNGIPGLYDLIYYSEIFFHHHEQKIKAAIYK